MSKKKYTKKQRNAYARAAINLNKERIVLEIMDETISRLPPGLMEAMTMIAKQDEGQHGIFVFNEEEIDLLHELATSYLYYREGSSESRSSKAILMNEIKAACEEHQRSNNEPEDEKPRLIIYENGEVLFEGDENAPNCPSMPVGDDVSLGDIRMLVTNEGLNEVLSKIHYPND